MQAVALARQPGHQLLRLPRGGAVADGDGATLWRAMRVRQDAAGVLGLVLRRMGMIVAVSGTLPVGSMTAALQPVRKPGSIPSTTRPSIGGWVSRARDCGRNVDGVAFGRFGQGAAHVALDGEGSNSRRAASSMACRCICPASGEKRRSGQEVPADRQQPFRFGHVESRAALSHFRRD